MNGSMDYFGWILISVDLVMVATFIYLHILYLIHYAKNRSSMNTLLFCGTQIFSIFVLLSLISLGFRVVYSDLTTVPFVRFLVIISYGNQMGFLYMVLFIRLKIIFHGTEYQLSKCTIRVYVASFVFMYSTIPVLLIIFRETSVLYAVAGSVFFVAGLLNVAVVALFINKLINVSRMEVDNNQRIINVITKTSILAVISCIFTILGVISVGVQIKFAAYRNSIYPVCFLLIDSYTNYICIVLSINLFQSKYQFFCGCIDRKCKSLCYEAKKIDVELRSMRVASISQQSPTSDSTNPSSYKS